LDYLSIDAFSFTACFFRLTVQKLEICVLNIPEPCQLLMVPNSLLMKLICSIAYGPQFSIDETHMFKILLQFTH
jgi:hypothetical protein